jgi:hypothetical protein
VEAGVVVDRRRGPGAAGLRRRGPRGQAVVRTVVHGQELERAVAHEFGVEAAVGGEVDVLEEHAVHGVVDRGAAGARIEGDRVVGCRWRRRAGGRRCHDGDGPGQQQGGRQDPAGRRTVHGCLLSVWGARCGSKDRLHECER